MYRFARNGLKPVKKLQHDILLGIQMHFAIPSIGQRNDKLYNSIK